MQRAQLTQLIRKLNREEQDSKEQSDPVESQALTVMPAYSKENRRIDLWHAMLYGAVSLPFVLLLAVMWMQPDLNRQETPNWEPVFALAEVARDKGELYNARGLYSQAGKFAAWREDWAGLLSAACGMQKLEREKGPRSTTRGLLLRAMVAAEARQSRSGMAAVAKAFATLGDNQVASMVVSRIQDNWIEKADSPDVALPDCWNR